MNKSSIKYGLIVAASVSALIIIALLLSGSARAAEITPPETFQLTIELNDEQGTIVVEYGDMRKRYRFRADEVSIAEGAVTITPDFAFTVDGILADGILYPIENLRVDEIYHEKELISVVLKHRKQTAAAKRRQIKRNRVAVTGRLVVDHDDYVRGDIICFGGNIEVRGEVNRNVVAIFGDVFIVDEGIVRGNVVAIDGKVNMRGEASVYGEIAAHRGLRKSGGVRVRFDSEGWGPKESDLIASYNRVDGLLLGGRGALADPDSLLPTIHASLGYAFESERMHYEVGVHQKLFDKYSFTAGGSFFRQTSTDDGWLSPRRENSLLAILAAEDFRDYYEEEGGKAYLTFCPGYYNEIGIGYRFTDLKWMDHHPLLWSLFGWEKEFRSNFSSIPADKRRDAGDQFDSKLGELSAWYTLDTRDDDEEPYSGWWAHVEYLTAGDRLKGDIAYDRLTAEIRRYQPITHRQNINVRAKYGIAGRDVPLFRQFYLGGMRTIRGLDHKSLIKVHEHVVAGDTVTVIEGEQMILGNLEYVINFPKASFETSLLFDVGKVVSRKDNIFSDGDFHSSVGIRLGFEDGFSLEVAKSLDDSDEPVKLWVLFQQSF